MKVFLKKFIPLILITVLLGGFLIPQDFAEAQNGTTTACWKEVDGVLEQVPYLEDGSCPEGSEERRVSTETEGANILGEMATEVFKALTKLTGWLPLLILKLASYLMWLGGMVLNFVVQYTIVDMKANLGDGSVIDQTWRTVRDVANMAFIFVLLYAGIQMILGIGKDVQRLIRNIVIVAILINFSLFFTKIVIDMSNVLAVTFYGAMVPGALTDASMNGGISNAMKDALHLGTLVDTVGISGERAFVYGIMGSVFVLIATFIFFAVALLLIIRFVVLIFVMILSPLAFITHILPSGLGVDKLSSQWTKALLGQSFFAPIYFLLTWIVIRLAQGLYDKETGSLAAVLNGVVSEDGAVVNSASTGSVGIVVNFIVITVFLVVSLIVAKNLANRAGGGISKLTSMATSGAGKASLGVAGFAGRQSLGKFGSYVGDNEKLKEAAAKGSISARLALKAGRKTGERSFDLRSTGVGGVMGAGKGQKGGFAGDMKKTIDEKTKFAASLGPSDRAKFKAEEKLKKAQAVYDATEKKGDTEETKNARERLEEARDRKNYYFGVDEREVNRLKTEKEKTRDEELKKIADKEKAEMEADPLIKVEEDAKKEIQRLEDELKKKERRMAVTTVPAEKKAIANEIRAQMDELDKAEENVTARTVAANARRSEIKGKYDEGRKIANDKYKTETGEIKEVNAANDRKFAYAESIEKSRWAKGLGYNYKASAAIRKGKSKKERLADLAKEVAKEDEEAAGGGEKKPEEKKPESGGESGEKKT